MKDCATKIDGENLQRKATLTTGLEVKLHNWIEKARVENL
jgi:hypothetical protein